tara:strand:+ start:1367 stop:1651 length:285 start_codon:yes stop_codon:yes gene_type:complete
MSDKLLSNPLGLPTKETRTWKVHNTTKVKEDHVPMFPSFCPCKEPETGKKCGNFMRGWDQQFYDQYGMCEKCYLKYNSHKEDIADETEKQSEAK